MTIRIKHVPLGDILHAKGGGNTESLSRDISDFCACPGKAIKFDPVRFLIRKETETRTKS